MIINHNMMAMNTYRQLSLTSGSQSKSMEKLSSGLRINRAGDDAAGLAISEKMRAQISGLNMASKNSQDGISLIQTAEGALNETQVILQRMRELATQAANDTNVTADRDEIQKEINQLSSEINRIGNTTEFNTMTLLNGDKRIKTLTSEQILNSGSVTVQYAKGVVGDAGLNNALGSVTVVAGDYGDNIDTAGDTIKITKTATGFEVALDASGAATFSADDTVVANADGNYVYDRHGVSFTISAADFAKITDGATTTITTTSGVGTYGTRMDWEGNVSGSVTMSTAGITVTRSDDTIDNKAVRSVSLDITSSAATIKLLDSAGATIHQDDYDIAAYGNFTYDEHGISFTVDIQADANASGQFTLTGLGTTEHVLTSQDDSLKFQVGANQSQSMVLELSDMRSVALGITSTTSGGAFTAAQNVTNGTNNTNVEYALDVSTYEKASAAITTINNAITAVSSERSKLGAIQNRLEHTIKNLDTSSENLQSAESRIRDVDMAKEMMNFTKQNILQQAATSMLAQANQSPQTVLQLLK